MTPDPAIARAFEATWPAAEYADTGALRTGRGLGAGGRVSSTIALAPDWSDADLDAAEQVHRGWDQPAMFRLPDSDRRLAGTLTARGYRPRTPTAIMAAACAALQGDVPALTVFALWPPIEIQRQLWASGHIVPARQAVMERVRGPRMSFLGQLDDRAAASAFAAIEGDVAMIHAIEVTPRFRRRGMAGWLIRAAAQWAAENGAARLGLAVSRANAGARLAYDRFGFREVGAYSYWARD